MADISLQRALFSGTNEMMVNLSKTKVLCSGHFIANTSLNCVIFRSQLTLPTRTDLSIAEKPNKRSCKTFLVSNLYTSCLLQDFVDLCCFIF